MLREGVFSFRSLEDCIEIVQYASGARHAVVIGGGLLGLETTHGLINRGLHVDVVHIASHLMDAQLELAVSGDKVASKDTDEVVTYVEPSRGIYKKLIVRDDHIEGAILLGDGATTPRLLQSFNGNQNYQPIAQQYFSLSQAILSESTQTNSYALCTVTSLIWQTASP